MIGDPNFYNFYPGNGNVVDLNGSNGQYGGLRSTLSFGSRQLHFDVQFGRKPGR